jgi:hypothetical protein
MTITIIIMIIGIRYGSLCWFNTICSMFTWILVRKACYIADTRVYPKVSGLAASNEDYKWYSSLPLGAVLSLFYESV